jgi:hypothetical protein
VRSVQACCVAETTYTVGVVAASMLLGGICPGEPRRGEAECGRVWRVMETTPVQERRPINAAGVGLCLARCGKVRHGSLRPCKVR